MLARPQFAALTLALACSPREPSPTLEHSVPATPPERPEPPAPPTHEPGPPPGRYATRVDFSGWVFVHTELRIDAGISGTVVVQLGDDGRVTACASARETSSSSSRDRNGKVERRDSDHAWIRGLAGTWAPQDSGGLRLRFERADYERCEVAPDRPPLPEPLEIDCTTTIAHVELPGPALLCEVPRRDPLASLALLLGDPPQAWELRAHLDRRAPIPEGTKPSLLLGADPGFELVLVERGSGSAEPLRITATNIADPVAPVG